MLNSTRLRWIMLALVGTILVVYGRIVSQDFVLWDDNTYTYENPYLNPLTWTNYAYLWRHSYEQMYTPLSYSLFALLMGLARLPQPDVNLTDTGALLNPHIFHATSLLLHLVNVLLMFALLYRCVGEKVSATLGALLFGLHPLQVESVAWASELRGLLCAAWTLGCLLVYLCFACSQQTGAGTKRLFMLYGGAAVLTVLALLSKPSAFSIPLIAFVLDRWVIGRSIRTASVSALGLLVLCLPIAWVTHASQQVPADVITPFWTRPLLVGDTLSFYLGKFFWPLSLGIDYGRTPHAVLKHTAAYFAWVIPIAAGAGIYGLRRKYPYLVVAGLISVAVLLPVSGLVPFTYQEHSTVADRYAYLALFGPALAVAFLGRDIKPKWAMLFAAPFLLALALLTFIQAGTWATTITLMRQAIAVNPASYTAHLNLGKSLSAHGRYGEAIIQDKIAVSLKPTTPEAHNNLAIDLFRSGLPEEALQEFQKTIDLKPDWLDAHYNYATALMKMGDATHAEAQLRQCLAINPSFIPAYMDIAVFDLKRGEKAKAQAELSAALQKEPDFVPAQRMLSELNQTPAH